MHLFHIPECSIQNRNFCSEWSILAYGTGAFWDLWNSFTELQWINQDDEMQSLAIVCINSKVVPLLFHN